MGAAAQKKKIMSGMSVAQARKRLREIFREANPGQKFDTQFKGVYPWMETWFRLRARSETFELVAQAFAEKIASEHKRKHGLEQKIHAQRQELNKLSVFIEQLRMAPDGFQSEVINRTRINWRWDEEAKAFVVELPRIITQADTKEHAIASLKEILQRKTHAFLTGEIDLPGKPTGGQP